MRLLRGPSAVSAGITLALVVPAGASAAGPPSFTVPGPGPGGRPDSTQLVVSGVQVAGAHDAGTASIEATPPGGGPATASVATAITAAADSSAPVDLTFTGLTPWTTYSFAPCFTSADLSSKTCGAAKTALTGAITTSDVTDLYGTYATFNALPSSPYPAGRLAFFLGTTDPGGADPRTVLAPTGGFAIPARGDAAPGEPIRGQVTNLTMATKYWWTACFGAGPAPDSPLLDCAPVRVFTTGTYDPPPVTTTPPPVTTAPVKTTTTTTTTTPKTPAKKKKDTKKPTLKLKVTGKVRRGAKLVLAVTATDTGGVRQVRIKVGRAASQAVRRKTVTLPKKAGTVTVVITATDRAGNVARLTKSFKVK